MAFVLTEYSTSFLLKAEVDIYWAIKEKCFFLQAQLSIGPASMFGAISVILAKLAKYLQSLLKMFRTFSAKYCTCLFSRLQLIKIISKGKEVFLKTK